MTSSVQPSRRSSIEPFHVMEVMRAAEERTRAGHEVLHLEVGQPGTPAPPSALAAARRALDEDGLGYTTAMGLPVLRRRIARWYDERYGVHVDPARVMVTTGASGSCLLAFLALWDQGARVGVVEPGYPCYRNDLMALGMDPVGIPVGPDTAYKPTTSQLDAVGPLDGLVLASPNNPTGTVLDPTDLMEISAWSQRHRGDRRVPVVVDEIYHGITYDRQAPSMLSYDDEAVVFNSFSKYFSMTGWRLGWIVAPRSLMTPLERLGQNLTIAAPTLSQVAALAAFDDTAILDTHVETYARNRSILLEGLVAAGIDRLAPADGAFYVWADVSHFGVDAATLCRGWLEELGIAATPGIDFDPPRGDRFVRFSYAGSTADISEAVARLAAWGRQR